MLGNYFFRRHQKNTSSSGRRRARAIEVIRELFCVCVHFNFLEASNCCTALFFATSERKTVAQESKSKKNSIKLAGRWLQVSNFVQLQITITFPLLLCRLQQINFNQCNNKSFSVSHLQKEAAKHHTYDTKKELNHTVADSAGDSHRHHCDANKTPQRLSSAFQFFAVAFNIFLVLPSHTHQALPASSLIRTRV